MPQEESIDLKILTYALTAFTIIPIIVLLLATIVLRDATLSNLRIQDLLDLALVMPVYAVSLVFFYLYLFGEPGASKTKLGGIFLFFVILFFEGHGMHFAANSINFQLAAVSGNPGAPSSGPANLVFFLDEILSHLFIFIALLGLFALALVAEHRPERGALSRSSRWKIGLIGLLQGVFLILFALEARLAVPMVVWAIAVLLGISYSTGLNRGELSRYLQGRPLTTYIYYSSISSVLGFILYFVVTGTLDEPSNLGIRGLL